VAKVNPLGFVPRENFSFSFSWAKMRLQLALVVLNYPSRGQAGQPTVINNQGDGLNVDKSKVYIAGTTTLLAEPWSARDAIDVSSDLSSLCA